MNASTNALIYLLPFTGAPVPGLLFVGPVESMARTLSSKALAIRFSAAAGVNTLAGKST